MKERQSARKKERKFPHMHTKLEKWNPTIIILAKKVLCKNPHHIFSWNNLHI